MRTKASTQLICIDALVHIHDVVSTLKIQRMFLYFIFFDTFSAASHAMIDLLLFERMEAHKLQIRFFYSQWHSMRFD